jgi:hypothetical protein
MTELLVSKHLCDNVFHSAAVGCTERVVLSLAHGPVTRPRQSPAFWAWKQLRVVPEKKVGEGPSAQTLLKESSE